MCDLNLGLLLGSTVPHNSPELCDLFHICQSYETGVKLSRSGDLMRRVIDG